ncbi:hypothetical protein C8J56DRAFT_1058149 [Mycena floridula]|nr:hypothetical protein C8J56DRAFT_1058149 [Mycena floridula]
MDELHDDPIAPMRADYTSVEEEQQDGVFVNDDNEIATGRELLEGLDVTQNNGEAGHLLLPSLYRIDLHL